MPTDQRLIEDYIPIEAISAEAGREKSIRRGYISTLHLWWARRPLVAARAAVYGSLVPAPTGKDAAKEAAEFVADLCTYPGHRRKIQEARRHILEAHAERGEDEDPGLPRSGEQAPLVDVPHRLPWLAEHHLAGIGAYLDQARPDFERLRLVAQTLVGQTLAGNAEGGGRGLVAAQGAEASALHKLTTN
jgi:hypothetical protein